MENNKRAVGEGTTVQRPRVLVVGAAGFFGSLLVDELLRYTDVDIAIAGRTQRPLNRLAARLSRYKSRLSTMQLDLYDRGKIKEAIEGASIVICAAGPYQTLPTILSELCIEAAIPYLDLADDRDFVEKVREMAMRNADNAVCTGWSSMPALSAVLVNIARLEMEQIDSIYIQIAPGNRAPRSRATVASLLSSVGKKFTIWRDSSWCTVTGFSEPRMFNFPQPVGSRPGYLVDVPDHAIFPELFGARTVEFRVGAEIQAFNHASAMLAWMRSMKLIPGLVGMAPLLEFTVGLFGQHGHDWGAIGVEVTGGTSEDHGADGNGKRTAKTVRVCLVSDHRGHHMPVLPAVIMVERLVNCPGEFAGLVPLAEWINQSELENQCEKRGYRLIVDRNNDA